MLQATKVPVKSSSVIVVKSRDGGAKANVPRLGVTRYVAPTPNPVCDQEPSTSVCTGGGMGPDPRTSEKVIVTPASLIPPPVTIPCTGYGSGASASATWYAPVFSDDVEDTSITYAPVLGSVKKLDGAELAEAATADSDWTLRPRATGTRAVAGVEWAESSERA